MSCGDRLYPRFSWSVSWTYEREDGSRARNSTGASRMFRTCDDWSLEQAATDLLAWWEQYEKKGKDPADVVWTITPKEPEAWCGGWFNHWTFDNGESDEEILASFGRYVTRVQERNWKERHDGDENYGLMGAEDRWRWCGSSDGSQGIFGVMEGRTEPPCRCDGCKKTGIVRICH